MIARINFDSYPTEDQKKAVFSFFCSVADTYNWNIQEYHPGVFIYWRNTEPFLLADTVTKKITAGKGDEPYNSEYDALSQFNTIFNAIKNNSRVVIEIGGRLWAFDSNGDVYVDKHLINSVTFEQIAAARASAMG